MIRKLSPTIICHSLCFLAVLFGSSLLIAYNTFHSPQNNRFSLISLLNPKTLVAMATYRFNPNITCGSPPSPALPSWLEADSYQIIASINNSSEILIAQQVPPTWSVFITDIANKQLIPLIDTIYFDGDYLTQSYAPVQESFMYPHCQNHECNIVHYNLKTADRTSFPAFAYPNPTALPEINHVFFDEARQLVSYKISNNPDAHRVVISTQSELIQTINERPSTNRRLQFKWYLPQPGLIVYGDPINQKTYFYQIDGIGLWRQQCR